MIKLLLLTLLTSCITREPINPIEAASRFCSTRGIQDIVEYESFVKITCKLNGTMFIAKPMYRFQDK